MWEVFKYFFLKLTAGPVGGFCSWEGWVPWLGPKVGFQGWVTRLGPKVGSQGWVPRLGPKVGSHGLVPWLGPMVGSNGWVPRLGPKVGSQSRSFRVLTKALFSSFFKQFVGVHFLWD